MNTIVKKFKKGYKIHIKESQKGSFTKWCGGNVTDACIRKGKNSSNPKIRKKATFAANARKWKHQEGGTLANQEMIQKTKQLGETPWVRHKSFEEYDSLGRPIYNRYDSFAESMQEGGPVISDVDTRSDTTRRGHHEGLPAYGAANARNTAGLWDLLNYNLTGNPYIITGAPDILPGKIGTVKKSIQSVANINDKGLNVTKKLNTSVKNGLTYEDFDVRHVNAGRKRVTSAQRERAQYMITNHYDNTIWGKNLRTIFKNQEKAKARGADISKYNKSINGILDDFIHNSGYFR